MPGPIGLGGHNDMLMKSESGVDWEPTVTYNWSWFRLGPNANSLPGHPTHYIMFIALLPSLAGGYYSPDHVAAITSAPHTVMYANSAMGGVMVYPHTTNQILTVFPL